MSQVIEGTKVITGPETQFSYCFPWEPKSVNGGNPKYSVCVMIPKTDTVTVEKLRKAIDAAYREGESRLKGSGKSVPPMSAIKNPLRDGDLDRPDDPAFGKTGQNGSYIKENDTLCRCRCLPGNSND